MIQPLRIYYGPEGEDTTVIDKLQPRPNKVTVPLGEVFPALTDALTSGRTWPQDFAEDEITISEDLYEILLAHEHYRRPSA